MPKKKEKNPVTMAEAAVELLHDLSDQALFIENDIDRAEYLSNEALRLKGALERIKDHNAYRQDWLVLRDKIAWYQQNCEESDLPAAV